MTINYYMRASQAKRSRHCVLSVRVSVSVCVCLSAQKLKNY